MESFDGLTTLDAIFPTSTPEAQGVPSSAIVNFIDAIEQHEAPLDAVHSFMLVRHGTRIAQGWWAPYEPEFPHMLYSLSKSFTSSAIGLAVSEGLLSVDDPVLSFFPDDAPEHPSDNLKAMKVKHLLSMNTGHHQDTRGAVWGGEDDNWPRAFLAQPVEYTPGTWFTYNTPATYMLSAIITQLTGELLIDYLRPRLFEPLGITNPTWDTDPQGRSLGGSGLHITTDGIARFGQMYLQKGIWDGKRILPEAWVEEATRAHSDTSNTQADPDWSEGYGYQFWMCRHNAYRGDGAFGQFCIVMPEQDAVLAITSGLNDLQGVVDNVWKHLLPAFGSNALPEDRDAYGALEARLAALTLPVVTGADASPMVRSISGTTYILESNDLGIERIRLDVDTGNTSMTMSNGRGEHTFAIGYGHWIAGRSDQRMGTMERMAACGAWTSDNTFEVRICYTESEVGGVIHMRFDEGRITAKVTPNVSWEPGPATRTLTGSASVSH
jgi:CubicO group peptidase (beta-lactamase class C family)